MQPCEQQDKIDNISATLIRMEKGQDRVIDLLEKVSNQEARLDHLEEHAERTYKDLNEIFNRLREAEMNIASSGPTVRQQFNEAIELLTRKVTKLNNYIAMIQSKPSIVCLSIILVMILCGTLLDFVNHFETLKKIWEFFK